MRRLLLLLLPLVALFTMPLTTHATEEPDFEVVRRVGNVELRQYAPHVEIWLALP